MRDTLNHIDIAGQAFPTFDKLIRIKDVCNMTGISRSHVYFLSSAGNFPRSVSLVPNGSSKAWVESEITHWIEQRIADRDLEVK
ncbi:AlpA family phage regulatory protein [Pseudomonadales bacterium]|nr:AlpA family phage regulatory protein [Pseudomonadales bacterium]